MIPGNEKYDFLSTSASFILISLVLHLAACNTHSQQASQTQSTIDSLQNQLDKAYKPGLGEFMTGIQLHHAKLWFAGQNQNWPLADFEIHEIQESLDDIDEFCKDRPEVRSIGMLRPAIDSVTNSIQQKSLQLFEKSFSLLTTTCNNCHKATDHGFNVVIIPKSPPVSNQDFKVAH
jgi:hypothetical protein